MITRTILIVVITILITLFASKFPRLLSTSAPTSVYKDQMIKAMFEKKPQTPVYFFSHGGPTFMYPDDDFGEPGAYKTVSKVGKYIKDVIKPEFVIVVSAHWETYNGVEIAVPKTEENELIYDFYGFPDYMYKEQFHTKSSIPIAQDIANTLNSSGISSRLTKRGIDHGVWVPFKVAFSTNKEAGSYWDLDVPVIQVSLQKTDDFGAHREVGKILSKYRELGGVVICSGMSVHNLRDMGVSMHLGRPMPYGKKFNSLLTSIVTKQGDERFKSLNNLQLEHQEILRKAHPTLEHFIPIVVASGAADNQPAKELYSSETLSLGWNVYQFGEYNK